MNVTSNIDENKRRLYRITFGLAAFTIVYNIIEGLVATYFGYEDGSLALFGFGLDSFIEAISGLGIAHMVLRIRFQPDGNRDKFENTALRITGVAFYLLAVGLTVSGCHNILTGQKPETTFWGVIISLISILIMWMLIYGKIRVGAQLNSEAILADARCTKVCIYMSVVLLAASAIYELTKIPYVDAIGTLGLAYLSYVEGKECFEKARTNGNCSCSHHSK
jgi:divalent metal cation (Fe/Co/Zn/Cd) transporter